MTSKQLKAWRERMHLKQIEAAKALGVAYSTYRQWEDGRITPHKLLKLATVGYEAIRSKEWWGERKPTEQQVYNEMYGPTPTIR